MNRHLWPHQNEVLAPAHRTLRYDAHLAVGRHGLSLFLAPTPYPTLDIDGTPQQLAQLTHALTRALTA